MGKSTLSQIRVVAIFFGIIVIIVGIVLLVTRTTRITEAMETGQIAGHDYVELGLSVKWATCNIGASSPSGYGNYYAWGETITKYEYTPANSVTYNKQMGSIAGNPQYDAATANWGDSWRMPTKEEIDELVNKCTWEWVEMDGHKGCMVTGSNGRSVFLPAAGYCDGSSLYYVGEFGFYWSDSPLEDNALNAYRLYSNEDSFSMDWGDRRYGRPVRAVSK